MLDIELLTQNNFLRKRCSEPTNVARCPECGSEFIQGTDGKISCPACLTTNPTGSFYCTRCHHETCGSGERQCSSIAAYEHCKSFTRPAFAPHEPLWQVRTRSDSTAQILEESNVRINIAAARFPAGTKIRGESDATDLRIEDVATFQDDLRRAPTPEEARLSGVDYMPSFGNWTPSDVGRPTFYEELMNEVASSPALEKLSSHLKEPSITAVEKQLPLIPPGMNPSLYYLVQNCAKIKLPMTNLIPIFLGEFHWNKGDFSRACAKTAEVFIKDVVQRTELWIKNIFLRNQFNRTQVEQAGETVRVFREQAQTLQNRLHAVELTEQAATAQELIAEAELFMHTIDVKKSKDKLKNIFQELVSEAQQYNFSWLENWYAEQLKMFQIAEAHFDQIGRELKRQLQEHGIQTAADVDAARIEQVSGFGPTRVNILLNWKQECKDIVAHRATPPIPPRRVNKMEIGLQAAIDLKKKHLACKQYVQTMNLKLSRLAMDIDTARRRFRTTPVGH